MSLRLKITQRKPPAVRAAAAAFAAAPAAASAASSAVDAAAAAALLPHVTRVQGFDVYYEALEAFEVNRTSAAAAAESTLCLHASHPQFTHAAGAGAHEGRRERATRG